ncbi:MAG: YihY family inner membrane protein [Phycisphaeraceae bacterium]|nr:MAG: YihY family inner membrane protein [Phycisphaeraceae bacterium]
MDEPSTRGGQPQGGGGATPAGSDRVKGAREVTRAVRGGVRTVLGYGEVRIGDRGGLGVVKLAVRGGMQAQLTRMAAALSYRTIFSLIPVLVIGLVVFGASRGEAEMRSLVSNVLKFSGISDIAVEPQAQPAGGGEGDGAVDGAGGGVAGGEGGVAGAAPTPGDPPDSPEVSRVDALITDLVDRVRAVPFATIGLIGLATLIYAALSMLVEVETSFNQVYRAPHARSWARRVTQYWTLLTLGPLLLFASFVVSEQFIGWMRDLAPVVGSKGFQDAVLGASGFLATVCISTLMFVVIYTTVPNTRVQLGPAVSGAFFAAVLWEIGKWGFRGYVGSAGTTRLYGALAMIPLFMLWVYLTWLIVLAGLQLSFALQSYRGAKQVGSAALARLLTPEEAGGPEIVDAAITLPMLAVITGRFRKGEASTSRRLAEEFAVSEPVALDLLDRLVAAGVLHRVTHAEDDRAFTLSRPPEDIKVDEILRASDPMWEHAERTRYPDLVRGCAASRARAMGGSTLAQLAPTIADDAEPTTGHGAGSAGAGAGAGVDRGVKAASPGSE